MRGILSPLELRRPWFRLLYWSLFTILFLLSISYLFPALWMLTGALKTSLELIRFPPTLLPEAPQWGNYLRAWNSLNYTLYFRNTLLNTWWAMWLLGAANAFNIFIFKRFFDQLSDDLIDAARIDGASAWQIFLRIALPLSKPVIGVVSIFTLIGSWKSFFWPLLVLTGRPDLQPIMLALYRQQHLQLNLLIAGLVIVSLPTIILFLIFQRQILQGFGFINFK
ncbi:MAG: carbohydrate ABC transporter permease [Deinococcota bacterium]|nr:carbohydrate ABC transporter permease [Deinococcota bacterium]